MTTDLIRHEAELALPPDIVLENARTAAKALADVLKNKVKPVLINKEQYLEFEDWQTVGQFYGYTVKTGDAVSVEVDGVKGAKAHADLLDLKTGLLKGGADAYCMRDEERWQSRPWYQLASMAQTRAGAKALRNRLAWVVVLAGYKTTPAEEMPSESEGQAVNKPVQPASPTDHYCPIHKTKFLKTAKGNYAHPVKENGQVVEWCNEPE